MPRKKSPKKKSPKLPSYVEVHQLELSTHEDIANCDLKTNILPYPAFNLLRYVLNATRYYDRPLQSPTTTLKSAKQFFAGRKRFMPEGCFQAAVELLRNAEVFVIDSLDRIVIDFQRLANFEENKLVHMLLNDDGFEPSNPKLYAVGTEAQIWISTQAYQPPSVGEIRRFYETTPPLILDLGSAILKLLIKQEQLDGEDLTRDGLVKALGEEFSAVVLNAYQVLGVDIVAVVLNSLVSRQLVTQTGDTFAFVAAVDRAEVLESAAAELGLTKDDLCEDLGLRADGQPFSDAAAIAEHSELWKTAATASTVAPAAVSAADETPSLDC